MPTVFLDTDSHSVAGVLLEASRQLTLGVVDVEGSSPPPQSRMMLTDPTMNY